MNENNTNGGPSNEAKTPHALDFNGTEIRPGLWAIEDDELQRIGNAAYHAGRGERDASASYSLGYEAGRVAGRGDSDNDLKRMRVALEASSARVKELRAALETTHQREMKVAGMLGCAPADVLQRIGTMLRAKEPREAEIAKMRDAQLRDALELASQQQAKIAAALGLEPGEDVLAEVQGVAEILRKSCAALGIHAEHAADLPSIATEYAKLRYEVIKALGFSAAEKFPLFLGRAINAEVDKATRHIDDARLRAVEALKQQDAEHGEAILKAVEAAEIRTRKACADQLNAAQAMIDRATKEHEEERAKLYARIADVEKQRDESREAHDRTLARVTELENEEIRLRHAETIEALRRARGYLKESDERWARFALDLRTILGAHHLEETLDAARRVVSERDAATKANACPACGAFSGTIRSTPGCTCGQAWWSVTPPPPCPVHGPSRLVEVTWEPGLAHTVSTTTIRPGVLPVATFGVGQW